MAYINHNIMAAGTASALNAHYGRLAVSMQRLSSGLRVNSAADDAAGLAIRELMRADVAALHQGVRNANDAISMIQVADGALAVIDEKLIRMKELAEQAATGTYDSTQRLMTVSNLTIQAENLQASESRISDADIAAEMTQFVRNQVLTQTATAMLGQANSYPRLLMSLLTG